MARNSAPEAMALPMAGITMEGLVARARPQGARPTRAVTKSSVEGQYRCMWTLLPLLVGLATQGRAADTEPPAIVHAPVSEAPAGAPLVISASFEDDSELFEPTLYYRPAGQQRFTPVAMRPGGLGYTATIPADALASGVDYFLEVYDVLGNGPATSASSSAPHRVVPSPPDASTPLSRQPRRAPTRLRIAGWSAVGLGVAGLGTGAYFGLRSRSLNRAAEEEPSPELARQMEERARSYATRANISLIAGAALGVGGVALLLLTGDDPVSELGQRSGVRLQLSPSGAWVTGTF